MNKLFVSLKTLILLSVVNSAMAVESISIKIAYIVQEQKVPAALSNMDAFIQYKGLMGAELGLTDNNTTGQFTGQLYELNKVIVPVDADVVAIFKQKVSADTAFVITNLSATLLKQLADLDSAQTMLFFDATTMDDALRNAQCRNNVFHMLPSRAMRADALAQFLMKKRWNQWFLVTGRDENDQLFGQAVRRAAKRFGSKVVADKQWTHDYDARRTAQRDVPTFTQVDDYDLLMVADEQGLFGEYLSYRTWEPRPVAGTQGLVPVAWHRTHEQWGAVQIQNRFKTLAGRGMEEEDYGAYLAVRSIGEAAVRTQSGQMSIIKDYLLSDKFALQGYKGKPLSFRSWNGQLRQPVLLAAARSLVSVAPIEGFLHSRTELDTLGFDLAESSCNKAIEMNETVIPNIVNDDNQPISKLQKIIKKVKVWLKE